MGCPIRETGLEALPPMAQQPNPNTGRQDRLVPSLGRYASSRATDGWMMQRQAEQLKVEPLAQLALELLRGVADAFGAGRGTCSAGRAASGS